MKHIKQFEELKKGVEIGDYILFGSKEQDYLNTRYYKYLETHIGKLFYYFDYLNVIFIEFDNLPENPQVASMFFDGNTGKKYGDEFSIKLSLKLNPNKYYAQAPAYIRYHSKNKEYIIMMLNSEKYNL